MNSRSHKRGAMRRQLSESARVQRWLSAVRRKALAALGLTSGSGIIVSVTVRAKTYTVS